jgi:hypothetical protein
MLLATRRTATAGALVMVAVMSNVVMLNFCFDVPVKLASTHLLVFALVIAAPDARRLWSVFCPRASTGPRDFTPRYARGWGRFVFRSSSSPRLRRSSYSRPPARRGSLPSACPSSVATRSSARVVTT